MKTFQVMGETIVKCLVCDRGISLFLSFFGFLLGSVALVYLFYYVIVLVTPAMYYCDVRLQEKL